MLKVLLKPFAYFILNLLDGYGWKAFLARLLAVAIAFMAVPLILRFISLQRLQ